MSDTSDPTTMAELLERIQILREKCNEQIGLETEGGPNPPAGEAQIKALEKKWNFTLPDAYRLFLTLHNGWEGWSGDVALLSTEQMLSGTYAEQVQEWEDEHYGPPDCKVIGFSLYAGEQILLSYDPDSLGEIIIWDNAESERHHDYFEFLVSHEKVLQELIANGAEDSE